MSQCPLHCAGGGTVLCGRPLTFARALVRGRACNLDSEGETPFQYDALRANLRSDHQDCYCQASLHPPPQVNCEVALRGQVGRDDADHAEGRGRHVPAEEGSAMWRRLGDHVVVGLVSKCVIDGRSSRS